jgi:hypothetical protein
MIAKEVHYAHASTMRAGEFEKFVDGSSSDHKNRHDKIAVIVPDKKIYVDIDIQTYTI